jgi:hypothetical protein
MMARRPPLYYPFLAPPEQEGADAPAFYAALGSTAAVIVQSGSGVAITITNPTAQYTPDEIAQPLATVVAPTRGYATFYPAADPLPTQSGQPLALPPGVTAADVGSVVLRIWGLDYKKLGTTLPAGALRPTHVVLGGIRRADAENAFKLGIKSLSWKVLRKAWQGFGSLPDRAGLEHDYLTRVMAHTAEVFIDAGDALGVATSYVDSVSGTTLGWLSWQAFAASGTNPPVAVDAMALLDDIFTRTGAGEPGSVYENHPLVLASSVEHTVTFQCQLKIWNSTSNPKAYVPFANGQVSLLRNGVVEGAPHSTDANGYVLFTVQLKSRDTIAFSYVDPNFTAPVKSEVNKTGAVAINGVIVKPFHGRYNVYERYRSFRENLWGNENEETYGTDRGNSSRGTISEGQEDDRLEILQLSEAKYGLGLDTSSEFNVLYEGDSWLFYPFSTDIYDWLHKRITDRIESPYKYNAFPLQYFGDRTDQMFAEAAPGVSGQPPVVETRQWELTKQYLEELPIHLIILSAGGNDIAEPGISDSTNNRSHYSNLFDSKGCFLPVAASQAFTSTPQKFGIARDQMSRSFAILLRNHPWNVFERTNGAALKSVAQIDQDFADHFTYFDSIGRSYSGFDRMTMAVAVLNGFPDGRAFPYSIDDEFDQFLDEAYDTPRVAARFTAMKSNIKKLLVEAQDCGVKVLGHSYSYPFFNEMPTYALASVGFDKITGPWFDKRFEQANLYDNRIKLICLKGLLDGFVDHVLTPLKTQYPNTFDFVDVRTNVLHPKYWRDEMHLKDDGFERVASPIYDRMVTLFPTVLS